MTPFLEPVLSYLRMRRVSKLFKQKDRLLDVGCGIDARSLRFLSSRITEGVGIDKVRTKHPLPENITVHNTGYFDHWDLPKNHFNTMMMLASLQYTTKEEAIKLFSRAKEHLTSDARVILTFPTPRAKSILEFLAFKVGLLSRELIGGQKVYFTPKNIRDILDRSGFKLVRMKHFQFGMNCLCEAKLA